MPTQPALSSPKATCSEARLGLYSDEATPWNVFSKVLRPPHISTQALVPVVTCLVLVALSTIFPPSLRAVPNLKTMSLKSSTTHAPRHVTLPMQPTMQISP